MLNHFQPHLHTAPGSINAEGEWVGRGGSKGEKVLPNPCIFQGQTQETSHSADQATRKLKLLSGWLGWGLGGRGGAIVLAGLCALDECSLIPTSPWLRHKRGPSVKPDNPAQKKQKEKRKSKRWHRGPPAYRVTP